MASPSPVRFDAGQYETSYSAVPRGDDHEPEWDYWQKNAVTGERRVNTFDSYSPPPLPPGNTQDGYAGGPTGYHGKHSDSLTGMPNDAPDLGKEAGLTKSKPGFETIFADVACVGIPLGLLGFAIATLIRDQDEDSEEAIEAWRNAASILSTLFPVLFAAIVGRLMMQAARWKLEEGGTLGCLEQLLGSRTVGGAFLTPFHLRTLNFLGVGLLLLWGFSPLGAQATLRMVELRLASRTEPSSALYFDTKAQTKFSSFSATSPSSAMREGVMMDQMATIYNGLLLAPMGIKNDTMDLWGNVKVPLFSSLERTSEDKGWTDVPKDDIQYSGLMGVPVVNITTGNTTFEMESNYLELVCGKIKQYDDARDIVSANKSFLELWSVTDKKPIANGTFQGWPLVRESQDDPNAPWSLGVDRLVDDGWLKDDWFQDEDADVGRSRIRTSLAMFDKEDGIEVGPTRLLFASTIMAQNMGLREHVATSCNVSQRYIESKITCEKTRASERETCRVSSQRPSQKSNPPEEITYLSFPSVLGMISQYFPMTTGDSVGDMSNADLTLQYLADPALANISTPERSPVKLADLDAETFSRRFTQALNSYIHVGQMYTNALGNINDEGSLLYQNTTAAARVTNSVHVYHVPKVWAALSIVSCAVMLAGGAAGVVFAHLAVGPEVLGFASTAVRDNKYVRLPRETARMEGTEISVSLRDKRVRFGVAQEGDVGVGFQDGVLRFKDAMKMGRG